MEKVTKSYVDLDNGTADGERIRQFIVLKTQGLVLVSFKTSINFLVMTIFYQTRKKALLSQKCLLTTVGAIFCVV